jgi:very-short-patch-repair endonuclease
VGEPVAGRLDGPPPGGGPQPLRVVLAEVLAGLLARQDPHARRLLQQAAGPLERAWLAVWWPTAPRGTRVEPQKRIGPYRVGFLVDARIVVEIDHQPAGPQTPDQAVRDRQRERYLVARGYAVLRFAGSEVRDDPWRCVAEVCDYLLASARRPGA